MARQEDQAERIQTRDKVLLFNSRVKYFSGGKLWSKWKGPYVVVHASSHGAVTLQDDDGKLFKVNGQHLKVFHTPYNPSEEFDTINLVEFDAFQTLHLKPQAQNHLHVGQPLAPDP